jgi:hypothetical protein
VLCYVCSKHVLQLEEILSNRIAQLVLLETENARLKQKERALQSCILGIEGSVAATRAVLEVEAGLESLSGKVDSSRSGDAGCVNTVSSDSCGAAAGTSGVDHTFNSPGSAAAQVSYGMGLLLRKIDLPENCILQCKGKVVVEQQRLSW